MVDNSDKVYNELIDQINDALDTQAVLKAVLSSLVAEQQERIFEKGLNANDQQIGTYSEKPISISKKNQVRKTKSSYFKGGYKEYKGAIGLDNSKVTLFASGKMKNDYSIIQINKNTFALGFKSPLNADKADGNEKRFKADIFAQSPNEDKLLDKLLDYELERIFND